jgi:hypothetical protein
MAKRKRAQNELQNTTQKTKDRVTRTLIITRGEQLSRKVSSSCSTCDTCCATSLTNSKVRNE